MKFPLRLLALLLLAALLPACHKKAAAPGSLTIAFMPKSKGNAYFIACRKGAEEAAKELGVTLLWDGPTEPDPARQNEIIETWITRGVDAIAVACENRDGIATALRKARARGIKVITYDADTNADARDFFCNQATPSGIAKILLEEAEKAIGSEGEYAIITGSLTATNMNEWQQQIAALNASKYPGLKLIALRPCDDLKDKAFNEATALVNANPDLKLILAITSPAVPGSAEAIKQAGRKGQVKLIGLGLPNENRRYLEEGTTDAVVLWKVSDLGYLTVQAAAAAAKGQLAPGATTFSAGKLGSLQIEGTDIVLGQPFAFTKENVGQYDF